MNIILTNHKKSCTTLFVLVICLITSAQEKYGHVTPQTAEFMKQGAYPVSLYTGKINISIPLYHYKDPDFDIPISISYSSDGFQPGKHSGFVGHDWILNAGGCITREIYNLPDEVKKTTQYEVNFPNGFLIQSRINQLNKNDVYNFTDNAGMINTEGGFSLIDGAGFTNNYDYMPDMFTFNFNGNSGNFIIGNDGNVRIISDQSFKIDLSGITGYVPITKKYTTLENTENSQEISEIILTDLKGYRFYFGGTIDAVEYNIAVATGENGENAPSGLTEQTTPSIIAWHLTKIIAPNGREVNYEYTSPLNGMGNGMGVNDPLWMFKKHITNVEINQTLENGQSYSHSTYRFRQSATKSVILNKIKIEDVNFTLSLNKSIEAKKLYHSGVDFCNHNYQLDEIRAEINDTLISQCRLTYDLIGGNANWARRFLKDVILFDGGKYSFSYNDNGTFPSTDELILGTIDDFGYWKANNFLGMIQSVSYPTGGRSEFTFEPHNYGLRRVYRLFNNHLKHEIESPSLATKIGGVRIKNIKNFSNNVLSDEKYFNYTTKFDYDETLTTIDEDGNTNTGNPIAGYECMNFRDHQVYDFRETDHCDKRTINNNYDVVEPLQKAPTSETIKSTGIFHSNWIAVHMSNTSKYIKSVRSHLYNIGEPHIGYSQVTEITRNHMTNEKHYLVSEFTDNLLQIDVKTTNTFNLSDNIIKQVFTNNHAYSSMSHKRGKLIKSSSYSSDLSLRFQSVNTYQHIGSYDQLVMYPENQLGESSDYIVTLFNGGDYAIARKIIIQPVNLKSKLTEEISSSSRIIKTLSYDYDAFNRIIREQESRSDGNWNFKTFRYPDNILPVLYTQSDLWALGYNLLNAKNMIGMPVEIVSGISDSTTDKVYNASILLFKPVGNLPAPAEKLEIRLKYPVSDYTPIQLNNSNIQYDNRMTNVASFEYNQLLRMTQITLAGELPLHYLWDSRNLYPIKEIQGDMITNYTYKTFVGMTSKTDPRGVKTIYSYDEANKLNKIYILENGMEKILQQFFYNYVNQ
ncbi:MAG: hypothetical protein LWW91_00940 [Bacteroidales bacterium]|nr:hypothetical protein [Bacteroidales bacterium]